MSTMDASSTLSDDLSDYDIISNPGQRSIESSIADLCHIPAQVPSEPAISQAAREVFYTASLGIESIQAYVRKAIYSPSTPTLSTEEKQHRSFENKTVRVYVDGIFDCFNAGHALQLRQAKLSFPSVHLMVGVFSDELCQLHNSPATVLHVERCEVVRHCRWVDEVIPDATWTVHEDELVRLQINYIALDEGTSVDPFCDKIRVKAYDAVKRLGKVIPTRRTIGLTTPVRSVSAITTPTSATPVQENHTVEPGVQGVDSA